MVRLKLSWPLSFSITKHTHKNWNKKALQHLQLKGLVAPWKLLSAITIMPDPYQPQLLWQLLTQNLFISSFLRK